MTHLHSTRRVFNSRTAGEVIREHKKHQNSWRLEDPTGGAYIAPQAQEHALPKATTPLSTLRTSSFSPWSRSNWSRDLKLLLNQGPLERCYATADCILVSRLWNCLLILRVVYDCMNVTVDLLIPNALMHTVILFVRELRQRRGQCPMRYIRISMAMPIYLYFMIHAACNSGSGHDLAVAGKDHML